MQSLEIPKLPDAWAHLAEGIDVRGSHWWRAEKAIRDQGIDDDKLWEARCAVQKFLLLRRCLGPREFAEAYAQERASAVGEIQIVHLTAVIKGYRTRPQSCSTYVINHGRARGRRQSTSASLAIIDIRPVQLGLADDPIIQEA